ncbi:hypothetical protein AB834_06200 [PVC group bacterium (ex Bugula neritina AB1)]|nr:hypothetical protein AB834_06200 [PVC group bacterium (ex Bugula neritina AB1)]
MIKDCRKKTFIFVDCVFEILLSLTKWLLFAKPTSLFFPVSTIRRRAFLPRLPVWFFIFVSMSCTSLVMAEEASKMMVDVDREKMTIGDRAVIVVKFFVPPNTEIKPLDTKKILENMHLKDYVCYKPEVQGDGQEFIRYDYIVTSYKLGEHKLGPFRALIELPSGEQVFLDHEPVRVEVVSVVPPKEVVQDIRDRMVPFEPEPVSWFLLFIILVFFIALLYFASKLFSKKKSVSKEPIMPLILPDKEALQALKALKIEDFDTQKKFYEKLTSILRVYFERRFHFPAEESTSEELLVRLKKHVRREILKDVKILNQYADLVKFAKKEALLQNCMDSIAQAKSIVERTSEKDKDLSEGEKILCRS